MKILVIFTGGTIGCQSPDQKNVLHLTEANGAEGNGYDYYLLAQYALSHPHTANSVSFDTLQPIHVLSENMTIAHWNELIQALKRQDLSAYKGIIITHGTDTMAYSAALFDLLLDGLDLPVVFVGSNYNLYDSRADGHQNFSDSVDFICKDGICGTFVIFQSVVYRGRFIKQSKHFLDCYESISGVPFGHIRDGVFTPSCDVTQATLPPSKKEPLLYQVEALTNNVLCLRPYPGLDYSVFHIGTHIKAVLHETYHSFTAGSDIVTFHERLQAQGVDLYVAPYSIRESTYATADHMLASGIRPIADISFEAAYAWLLIQYNGGETRS